MWHVTIIANAVMMWLFWLLSLISILPAYNNFVQYADQPMALPALTHTLIRFRFIAIFIPICWSMASWVIWKRIKNSELNRRNEVLLTYTSITICIGIALWMVYLLGGIIPFLYIGGALA